MIMKFYITQLIATLAFFATWATVCVFFFSLMTAP